MRLRQRSKINTSQTKAKEQREEERARKGRRRRSRTTKQERSEEWEGGTVKSAKLALELQNRTYE